MRSAACSEPSWRSRRRSGTSSSRRCSCIAPWAPGGPPNTEPQSRTLHRLLGEPTTGRGLARYHGAHRSNGAACIPPAAITSLPTLTCCAVAVADPVVRVLLPLRSLQEIDTDSSRGARDVIQRGLAAAWDAAGGRSEEHTSELQSPCNLVCRLLLEKKKEQRDTRT